MKYALSISLTLIIFFFILSCSEDAVTRVIPDVSDITVDVELRRFEKDLFALDTNNLEAGLTALQAEYPTFSDIYFHQIFRIPQEQEILVPFVAGFLKNEGIQHLRDSCSILYDDFSDLEQDFEQAFKFLNYYFPEVPTPDLTTFLSEYGVGSFIYKDQSLAIGLDFFLGEDHPYQAMNPSNPTFSAYLTRTFNKEHLVLKTIYTLVDDMVGPPQGDRMIDEMINNGKKYYIVDLLLPRVEEYIKLEVTPEQVDWLRENEYEMWAFFLEKNLLYTTSIFDIKKYTDYGPNSQGMPTESPGRTGNWIGFQMVKRYMANNPNLDVRGLLAQKDAQEIMDKSRYKPRLR